jgi:predicted transcriptional regulator
MDLLKAEPELSVAEISEKLKIGYENASDHVRKLAIAGLVMKRNEGSAVRHKLTQRGESILVFCKRLA